MSPQFGAIDRVRPPPAAVPHWGSCGPGGYRRNGRAIFRIWDGGRRGAAWRSAEGWRSERKAIIFIIWPALHQQCSRMSATSQPGPSAPTPLGPHTRPVVYPRGKCALKHSHTGPAATLLALGTLRGGSRALKHSHTGPAATLTSYTKGLREAEVSGGEQPVPALTYCPDCTRSPPPARLIAPAIRFRRNG